MKIHLYDDGASRASVDMKGLAAYAAALTGERVILRTSPVEEFLQRSSPGERESILDRGARVFARARIRDAGKRIGGEEPLAGELSYEKKRLAGERRTAGIPYDGQAVQEYFAGLIPHGELGWRNVHIVVTDQLMLTWDDGDRRYHARVVLLGYPSIISVRGIIEGPARPREYYLERGIRSAFSPPPLAHEDASKDLRRRFLDHGDARITEIAKGPVCQALFFHAFGEVFCPDRGCRLFNAHWQEDLLFAQMESGYEFCPRHAEMIKAGFAPQTDIQH